MLEGPGHNGDRAEVVRLLIVCLTVVMLCPSVHSTEISPQGLYQGLDPDRGGWHMVEGSIDTGIHESLLDDLLFSLNSFVSVYPPASPVVVVHGPYNRTIASFVNAWSVDRVLSGGQASGEEAEGSCDARSFPVFQIASHVGLVVG
ncbi:hypothetical protein BC938DRAFT_471690 [Jimgerdemannia flammicorona]|uniref:Uncharacterized protein n=1 Tax=Jimgerdemannia flammicorona TaxID=994334 RepID=A0A433Q7L8_9FUNG|nr:hypothetical protein BC938DRAFT_471690 [Jimgerdemannia flammicorona]